MMTLSDHLREIYNLSPDAIRALLGNDDEALDIHEINALLFEFTHYTVFKVIQLSPQDEFGIL